jgi:hypothetical protein
MSTAAPLFEAAPFPAEITEPYGGYEQQDNEGHASDDGDHAAIIPQDRSALR